MHQNPFWLGFLSIIGLIVLGYSMSTAWTVYSFYRLDQKAPLDASVWSIVTVAEDEHIPEANYSFTFDGKTYQGSMVFKHLTYKNAWALKQSLSQIQKEYKTVWFSSQDPTYSSLQKSFPLKECIYTACLWGLLLYFIWLGYHVTKYN